MAIATEKQIRLVMELMEKKMDLEFEKYELELEEKDDPAKERQELIQKISDTIKGYDVLAETVDRIMKE